LLMSPIQPPNKKSDEGFGFIHKKKVQ